MEQEAEALLQELAKSILEWERADNDVKNNGWTERNEAPWEQARARMVELARKVHDKETIDEQHA